MENKERRQKLREALERIVKTSKEVSSLMREVPHPEGVGHRSLKYGLGECVIHTEDDSVISTYKSKDGDTYQITITKR